MQILNSQNLFQEVEFKIEKPKRKIDFEFQALCLELENFFGKNKRIWSLPYQVWFNEKKGWDALKIAKQRGINNLNYFIGIVKKL